MWHQRMKMSPRQLLLILGITAAAVSAQGESLTDDWTPVSGLHTLVCVY